MGDDGDTNGAGESDTRPEAVAHRVADAAEGLVGLWASAGDAVSPRLSAQQLRALKVVRHRSELNLTALAEILEIALPAASRLCDRLETAGLLERVPHPGNRRELQLLLTPQGRSVLAEIAERRSRSLASVLAAMTPAQRVSLESGLRGFHRALDAPGGEPGRLASGTPGRLESGTPGRLESGTPGRLESGKSDHPGQ